MKAFVLPAARIALFAVSLASCATTNTIEVSDEAETGRRIAEQRCSGCHSAAPGRPSPHRSAPPFWLLDGLHTPESLQRSVASSPLHSQFGMPDLVLSRSEAAAVVAYIEAVGAADAKQARRIDMPPCIATAC